MIDKIEYITKPEAVNLINTFHYSKVLPRINKYFIGGYHDKELVAVCTLGWGVRPRHTIDIMFPGLTTEHYFEIGKLCVSEKMPKNTESNFLSKIIKEIKRPNSPIRIENPDLKILYSWADGILGKPGYIYQASNFYYGGFIWAKLLLNKEGNKIHERTLHGISGVSPKWFKKEKKYNSYDCDRSSQRMKGSSSYEATQLLNIQKYVGLQFRYLYPVCGKREWKRLQRTSPFEWKRLGYPKDKDCKWRKQISLGKYEDCEIPEINNINYQQEINKSQSFNDFFQN